MIGRRGDRVGRAALLCAVALCVSHIAHAQSQPVTRVKAVLLALNGDVMTLEPVSAASKKSANPPPKSDAAPSPNDGTMTVTLLDETRYVLSAPSSFDAIKVGDYAGAAVTEKSGGWLRAQTVYLYDPALRGSGEGRFPDQNRLLVNGTVSKVQPTAPQDTNDGTLTLHYHGAVVSPAAKGLTVCEGRAAPAAFASALACEADAVVEVLPGTPVAALTPGDRTLLSPGATVTVAITKVGERTVAPGVIVEKPVALEKPQAAP